MKVAIRYNPNFGAFTPRGVRDMIRAADSGQMEFRGKGRNEQRRNQKHGGTIDGTNAKGGKNDGQQQEIFKDSKKREKLRKCHICESTEHLRADCPDCVNDHSGGGANATEKNRKPRGSVTIRQDESESPAPDNEDDDIGVVTGVLDPIVIDAAVEAEVSDESHDIAREDEVQEETSNADDNDVVFNTTNPDIHHIRKFGALAYVYVSVSPGRRKHHDNAKLESVLGYAEDVVWCKVYFPAERTVKFVPDLRVAEDVVYRDRHNVSIEDADLVSLHFKISQNRIEAEYSMSSDDIDEKITGLNQFEAIVVVSIVNELESLQSVELEGDEAAGERMEATETALSDVSLAVVLRLKWGRW
ncbi:hypothetical protein PR001_g20372 [Phytophthora rubi]|nr:hypothetical protein PR001_g20372 [Phytophthora rubi]